MRNKNLRRGAALLLSLAMCLGFLPGTAWAVEEECQHTNAVWQNHDNGYCSKICLDCGDVVEGPLNHDWEYEYIVDGPADKHCKRTCTRCEAEIRNAAVVDESHVCKNNSNDGIVTKPATCVETGEKVYSCRMCGEEIETQEISVDPNAHLDFTWVVDEHEGTHQQICVECRGAIGDPGPHIENEGTLNDDETQMVFHCKECGVETRRRDVLPEECEHSYAWVTTKEPTCTETGTTEHRCKKCGKITATGTLSKAGHTYEQNNYYGWEPIENTDQHGKYCTSCEQYIGAAEHVWKQHFQKPTIHATCDKEGTKFFLCEKCGAQKEETIEKLEHKFSGAYQQIGTAKHAKICENGCIYEEESHEFGEGAVTKEPTCVEAGEKTFTCVCGLTRKESVSTTDHVYKDGKCENCGEAEPDHEHNYVLREDKSFPPACEKNGVNLYQCSLCEETKTEILDSLGHDYKAETKDASCTEGGETTYTCRREGCDSSYTVQIPVGAHVFVQVEAKDATCIEKGNTAHMYCSVCGRFFVGTHEVEEAGVELPLADHNWVENDGGEEECSVCHAKRGEAPDPPEEHEHTLVTVRVEPKCTEDGWEWTYCSGCEYDDFKVIPATGEHTPDCGHGTDVYVCEHELEANSIASAPAACEKPEYIVSNCSKCSLVKVEVGQGPLGHDFGEWTVTREATAEEEGEETRSCQRTGCNKTETRAVPALGGGTTTPENPNPPTPPTTPETPDNPEPPTPPTM